VEIFAGLKLTLNFFLNYSDDSSLCGTEYYLFTLSLTLPPYLSTAPLRSVPKIRILFPSFPPYLLSAPFRSGRFPANEIDTFPLHLSPSFFPSFSPFGMLKRT